MKANPKKYELIEDHYMSKLIMVNLYMYPKSTTEANFGKKMLYNCTALKG